MQRGFRPYREVFPGCLGVKKTHDELNGDTTHVLNQASYGTVAVALNFRATTGDEPGGSLDVGERRLGDVGEKLCFPVGIHAPSSQLTRTMSEKQIKVSEE